MDRIDRLQVVVSYALIFLMLVAGVTGFFAEQWLNAFLGFLSVSICFVPALIERNSRVHVPVEFELVLVFFVFVTIYLGEIEGYYQLYWWWDKFLHTLSGIILGLLGFVLVYIFNSEQRIKLHLSPVFVGLFCFLFAVSMGTFWEIYEFCSDTFFGSDMQHNSNFDTMTDLIVDALGALITAAIAYFYEKRVEIPVFDRMIRKFVNRNPIMFRRWKWFRKLRGEEFS